MTPIRNGFTDATGRRATFGEVLLHAVMRITSASDKGTGLHLSAAEVRALNWAVIREEGEVDKSRWEQESFDQSKESKGPQS